MLIKTSKRGYDHLVRVPSDDGQPTVFYWAFPKGTLRPRMSALELGEFLLGHIPAVLPLISSNRRAYNELMTIWALFATMPKQAIDQVLPWIQSVCREGPDDVIIMTLDPTKQRDTNRTQTIFY